MKLSLISSALLAFALAGCGGATIADPTQGSDPSHPGGPPGAGPGAGGGGTPSVDAGTVPGAQPDGGRSDSGAGGGGGGGGGGTNPGANVHCGSGANAPSCNTATEICCVTISPTWTSSSGRCVAASSPSGCGNSTDIKLTCDTNASCPAGKVCCGAYDPNTGYSSVRCADSCIPDGVSPPYDVPLCNPNAAIDECQRYRARCAPSSSLPGYYACAWAP